MMLRLNKYLMLAESIVCLHTRLHRPITNFRPFPQCVHHFLRVVHNAREYPFLLPQIFMPKEVHLRLWQLKYITIHHPEHLQVARQRNLTTPGAPQHIEPPQHGEFKAYQVSVEDLDMVPYLKHFENITESRSQQQPLLLPRTET